MKEITIKSFFLVVVLSFIMLNVNAQSVGGVASGAKSYCTSTNTGFVSLTGHTGSVLNWESSINGGVTWTNIGNPTTTQSYFNLTQSTCYRAVVKNAAFPADTSTKACITVYGPSVGGTVAGGGTFCGGSGPGSLNLTGNTGNVIYWQYSTNNGTSWTTVSNTTTTLTYTNIAQSTLYRAIVQNGASCPTDSSSKATFTIHPLTVAGTILSSDTLCYAANSGVLSLTGNVGSILGWIYSIDNGTNWNPIANTTTSQSYGGLIQSRWFKAIVKSATCKTDTTANVKLIVLPLNPVNAGNDTTIVQGKSVTLNGSGNGIPLWSPSTGLSNAGIYKPVATPGLTTSYVLTVIDTNGCSNADTVVITVNVLEFNGMVSNLFTPNGDGINDGWYIQDIQNYPENEVFVFNIYGNEVYSGKKYMNDWQGTYNGSPLPDGTYYYIIKFEKPDKIIKGSVEILRSK